MLAQMSILRTGTFTNSNGNKSKGKLWLLGANECKLSECTINQSKNGNSYITARFIRRPQYVYGLKTKVSFAPLQEFVFDYVRASEICNAFGHELKPKPDDMEFNVYMSHVKSRFRTFIGQGVQIVVSHTKEAKKDSYGFTEKRISYDEDSADVSFYRIKAEFRRIDKKVIVDWDKITTCFKT